MSTGHAFTVNLPIIDDPGIDVTTLPPAGHLAGGDWLTIAVLTISVWVTIFILTIIISTIYDRAEDFYLVLVPGIATSLLLAAFVGFTTHDNITNNYDIRRAAMNNEFEHIPTETLEDHFTRHTDGYVLTLDEDFTTAEVADLAGKTCRHNLEIDPIADDGTADLTFAPDAEACDPLFRHEPLVAADISDTTEKG